MTDLPIQEILKRIKKNSITVQYQDTAEPVPIGGSKFGGNPHLPKDFSWYTYEGESFEGVTANRPLSFLAQINLAETAALDQDHCLPSEGMLYFFYELETMFWGFDPKNKGCARVYYYDGSVENLVETPLPEQLQYVFPEKKILFDSALDLPDFSEFYEHHCQCDWDHYDQQRALFGYREPEEESVSKLLGYANIIQNDMLLECEQVTNGIYCGSGPVEMDEAQAVKLFEQSKDWTLLFQMSTVAGKDFELMFGDCGNIYFYIKKQDLQEKRFDRVWLILQCY